MDYCQSKQLRPKTMASYEQTLKLFARWMEEEKRIARAEDVTEQHMREYIIDLQKRGKYTFCFDDRSMKLTASPSTALPTKKWNPQAIPAAIPLFHNWLEQPGQ